MCDDVFDCGPLMLANAGLLCRGDAFKSGVGISGEVWFESVNGLQSAVLIICGEPIIDGRLMPPYCSILLAQLSLWSGLLTTLSSLLRRPGLAFLSSFKRLPSIGKVRRCAMLACE
jgi:hypothetical protein